MIPTTATILSLRISAHRHAALSQASSATTHSSAFNPPSSPSWPASTAGSTPQAYDVFGSLFISALPCSHPLNRSGSH
ncbi:hypothetical protein BASA61_009239 [Batrachochytrium salamandrivorans]|nr:hypothetical protein BASA61_009239 [Batrachochytrium salamandrivorans]